MHTKTLASAAKIIAEAEAAPPALSETFYTDAQDVFLPYLDQLEGSTINASDYSIFTKLTRNYEERFMRDLRDLNVLVSDELTRVTEYGPQIANLLNVSLKTNSHT
jgi:cysteinyl-tRNA synthetase